MGTRQNTTASLNTDPNAHSDFLPLTSANGSSVKLTKLNEGGSNWVMFKHEFVSAVSLKGLRRYLEGREKRLEEPTAPGVDPDADDKYDQALDIWRAKHDTIKTILFQSLPDTLKLKIISIERASDVWKVVTNKYDNQGNYVQISILNEMQSLKADKDPRPTLHQLKRLKSEYATAGGTLNDNQYIANIVRSLPNSYRDTIRTLLLNTRLRFTPLTSDELIFHIEAIARDEEALDGKSHTAESALAASSSNRSKVTCFNCEKPGHMKKDCWAKGGGKEGQGPKRKWKGNGNGGETTSANVAAAGGTASEGAHAFHVATDFRKVVDSDLVSKGYMRLLDSGASRHFDPDRKNFTTYREIPKKPVNSAEGGVFHAIGEGDVPVSVRSGNKTISFVLRNVLHAPTMPLSLVSVSQMVRNGYPAHFEKDGCHVLTPKGEKLLLVPEQNGLYPMKGTQSSAPASESAMATTSKAMTLLEFHRRMGHAQGAMLKKMVADGLVTGIELSDTLEVFCEACIQAKQTTEPFPKERSSPRADRYGGRVHSNVWGPAPVRTPGGNRHWTFFLDDHSDEVVLALMREKSNTFEKYCSYEAWAKGHRGVVTIGELQSDRGGEYTSNEFSAHLKTQGTVRRLTVHDSPPQNGKSERLNRTIEDHSRAMLIQSELPRFLWGEAAMHAVWLRNRTTTVNTPGSTPHERVTGKRPDLSGLPGWGAKVWVKVKPVSKMDVLSKEARWVGFDAQSKGHRIYWPGKQTVSVERNVRFQPEPEVIEIDVPAEGEQNVPIVPPDILPAAPINPPAPIPAPNLPPAPLLIPKPDPQPKELPPSLSVEIAPEPVVLRRSGRDRHASQKIRDLQTGVGTTGGRGAQVIPPSILNANAVFEDELDGWEEGGLGDVEDASVPVYALAAMTGNEPTYWEAMRNAEEKPCWMKAMVSEVGSLEQMKTYEVVERPPDINVVGSVWALRKKRDENNKVARLKARLCAQGFSQIYGIDYDLTAAPTVRLSSIRYVFALAASKDWEIHQIDFKNAYLNGDLDETIYMELPPGFQIPGYQNPVLKLLKALYGLKQAGRQWYLKLKAYLESIGLKCCDSDPGIFYQLLPTSIIIITIHVDDCALITDSEKTLITLKDKLRDGFEIVDLGQIRWYTGFEVCRDRAKGVVSMSQAVYVDTLVDRFGLTDAYPLSAPLDPATNLFVTVSDADKEAMRTKPYARLIGSLMYAQSVLART
ncbi:hypothetical protein EUX98_g9509 [Antrodiella citrinella]|uniref:Integrase catalytic domain-containing protein n=1 Tax=Antrodiella citrinella TaxID=2447956 RepID=A0A4S4LXT6_9APHY|nr:hypothetical protein EUX98_g9509 [Antrodiella citrinella]